MLHQSKNDSQTAAPANDTLSEFETFTINPVTNARKTEFTLSA